MLIAGGEVYRGGIGYNHASETLLFLQGSIYCFKFYRTVKVATFAGTVTATTFLGNSTTQTAGDNSTKIATTAYADAAAAAVPIGNYLPLSAGSSYPLTGTLYGTSTNWSGSGDYAGSLTLGTGASTQEAHLQIGPGRTGNGFSYIDLIGDATYTDYGFRMLRGNTGPNALSILEHRGTGNFEIKTNEASAIIFETTATERMRIDSSGNVGIGTTSPNGKLEIEDTTSRLGTTASLIVEGRQDGAANVLTLRSKDYSAPTVAIGANHGAIMRWQGFDGTDFENMGYIFVGADGQAVANGDAPSYMAFGTSADGSSSPTERMRITSGGNILVGGSNDYSRISVTNGISTRTGITLSDGNTASLMLFAGNNSDAVIAIDTQNLSFKTGATVGQDNGTERMRITSAGNVGIGVTSPTTGNLVLPQEESTQFKIAFTGASSSSGISTVDQSGSGLYIGANSRVNTSGVVQYHNSAYPSSGIYFDGWSGDDMEFYTGASGTPGIRMRINSTGAIQFNNYNSTNNTGTPTFLLGTDASGNVVKTNTVPGSGAGPYLPLSAGPSYPLTGDLYQTMGAIGVAQTDQDYLAKIYESNSDGFMSLYTGQPTPLERIRISSYGDSFFVPANNGNVGIGTTSPSKKLEVNGSFKLGTNAYIEYGGVYPYTITTANTAGVGNLVFSAGLGSAAYESRIDLQGTNTAGVAGITLSTASTARMAITADGNVGIGTTSPQAKLHVSTSDTTKFIGTNADYVVNSVGSGVLITTGASTGNTYSQIYAFQSGNTAYANLVVPGGNVGIGVTGPDSRLTVSSGTTNAVANFKSTDAAAYIAIADNSSTNALVNQIGVTGNDMWFATDDVERMRINSAGAIKFNAYDSTNNTGTPTYLLGTDASGNIVKTLSSSAPGSLWAANGNDIYNTNSGNVGIGEDTPENILHIKTAAAGGPQIQLESTSGTAAAAFINFDSTNLQLSTQRDMVDGTWYDTAKSWGGINIQGPAGGSFITFQTAAASNTSPTERFRIASDGKIQVGSDKVIWAGGYGGALVIRQNNATSDRLIKMVTVDSTGAIANDNVLVAKGANVGIGTASPSAKLVVQGTAGGLYIDDLGAGYNYYDASEVHNFRNSAGSSRLYINASSGNVGIGTTSPDSKLEVAGQQAINWGVTNSSASGLVTVGEASTTVGGSLFVRTPTHNTYYPGGFAVDGAYADIVDRKSTIKLHAYGVYASGWNADMAFYTSAGAGETEKMRIDAAGNVGIGTSTPNAKLDIQGTQGQLFSVTDDLSGSIFAVADISGVPIFDVNSSGVSYFDGNVGIGTTSPAEKLSLPDNAKIGLGSSADLQIYHDATNSVISNSAGHLYIKTTVADKDIIFEASNGAGSVESYLEIDSDQQDIKVNKRIEMTGTGSAGGQHTIEFNPGTSAIGYIYHDDTNFNVRAIKASSDLVLEATHGNVQILNGNGSGTEVGVMIEQYIAHIGDTDTKFGFTAANQFQVIAGGNTNLNVQGNGVDLSYAGSTKLTTQTGGIAITGELITTGDVGIGVTNPSAKLHVDGDSYFEDTVSIASLSSYAYLNIITSDAGNGNSGQGLMYLENTNAATSGGAMVLALRNNYGTGFGNYIKFFKTGGTTIGEIYANSGRTNVVYSTSSDYRLKEDLKTFKAVDIINQIPVYDFKWKETDFRDYGVLAHEMQAVLPGLVKGDKDGEENQTVDYMAMVPILMQSIKELKAEIELLKQNK